MPIASTSTRIFPRACVASVWKMMPFSLASLPIAATSWIVPISLFANITEIRIVLSVTALRTVSTSTRPSGCTGTYATSKPCRSSRLHTSSPARCSITVVTMWLPFSRYISATPLMARLMDSVPPDVKTSSFASRAPIRRASCARASSTAASASQPNGWLRLAGWPNFSVKYGSIASTTRGSTGVVDCASRKIGNFSAMSAVSLRPDREDLRDVVARQLREAHRVEQLADRRLELLHRPPQVAARLLRTPTAVQAAHDADRSLQGAHHFAHADLVRLARQHVAALRAVLAHDQPALCQALEDLRQELGRDPELLGDALGADGAEAVMDGDIMNRHQPIIGALGEPKHRLRQPSLMAYGRLFRSATDTVVVSQWRWGLSRGNA